MENWPALVSVGVSGSQVTVTVITGITCPTLLGSSGGCHLIVAGFAQAAEAHTSYFGGVISHAGCMFRVCSIPVGSVSSL